MEKTVKARTDAMKYIYLMNQVKPVNLVPGVNMITRQMATEYLEVPADKVSAYCSAHKKEMSEYGTLKLGASDMATYGFNVMSRSKAVVMMRRCN